MKENIKTIIKYLDIEIFNLFLIKQYISKIKPINTINFEYIASGAKM